METESEYKSSGLDAIRKYFEVFMSIVYAALGVAILTRYQDLLAIPPAYSAGLGIALVIYGIYRGYRAFQRYF